MSYDYTIRFVVYRMFCIYLYLQYCILLYIVQYNISCSLQNIPFARADLLRATAQASKGTNNKYFILKEIKACHVTKYYVSCKTVSIYNSSLKTNVKVGHFSSGYSMLLPPCKANTINLLLKFH